MTTIALDRFIPETTVATGRVERLLHAVRGLFSANRRLRAAESLGAMSDHQLRDMGIDRSAVLMIAAGRGEQRPSRLRPNSPFA